MENIIVSSQQMSSQKRQEDLLRIQHEKEMIQIRLMKKAKTVKELHDQVKKQNDLGLSKQMEDLEDPKLVDKKKFRES